MAVAAAGVERAGEDEFDQTRSAPFRGLLAIQCLAATFFGAFPLVAPGEFARLFSLVGDEPYLYRLAGAATFGYAVVGLVGAVRPSWRSLRIPIVATFTFNVAAVAACLASIDETGLAPLPALVALAASLFAVLSASWLYRDEGPRAPDGETLEPAFRVVLVLATASAGVFGVVPLLLPRTFADLFGLSAADLVLIRLAGAATLGYAVAGVLEVLANRWPSVRLQVVAAIAFNALAAVASAIYLAGGGGSILGIVVLLAAGFFTFALTGFAARAQR